MSTANGGTVDAPDFSVAPCPRSPPGVYRGEPLWQARRVVATTVEAPKGLTEADRLNGGRAGPPRETVDRREAVRLYTKAVLKRLGWTAVVGLVAVCVFLVAMSAGLPQMPTVGFIMVAIVACAIVLGRVFKSTESGDSPDGQNRD
jgi:hypothetical protein